MTDGADSPLLGSRFDAAFALASELHRSHRRKGTSIPYLSHLLSVAALVIEDGGDEDEAIAALLHDALEDCPEQVTAEEIEARFGSRVRLLVEACTDTPEGFKGGEKPPWEVRKFGYLVRLASGHTPYRVSLADKLHNARSILRDYRDLEDVVWDRFSAKKDKTLWYYRSLGSAYRAAGAKGFLINEFERTVDALEQMAKER